MRILHIHTSMAGGGIESMVCGIVNEMAKTKDVTLCTIFKPKHTDVFEKKLSQKVKRDNLGKEKTGFSLKEIYKIYKYIKNGKFDIVHIHGFFYYYFISILLLHSKTKFVYTIHSDAKQENVSWDARLFKIKRMCFKRGYMKAVTISEVSQESFNNMYNCNSNLIKNGIPKSIITDTTLLNQYKITLSTKILFHAGRISEPKNQLLLCKVADRLIKEGFDIVLLIAGGNQDPIIYNAIEPYFSDRIKYLGERNDIPQLFASSDAMCLPSIWEGLPVVLLEALSVGCIPVCTPVGGIPNVIKDGENGFLSKDSSFQSYYETLKSFLKSDKEVIKEMKKNCIKSFEPYSIEIASNNYINFYRSIK